jgi:hypothetical protein
MTESPCRICRRSENNNEQRRAVEHSGDQPLLISAGAGSSKTNTLAHRVDDGIWIEAYVLADKTERVVSELCGFGCITGVDEADRNTAGGES